METLEEKSLIYRTVKERYFFELERKNELNNAASIPFVILSVLLGGLAYLFKNAPENSDTFLFVVYYTSFFCSVICLAFCFLYFYFHQVGYNYCYISNPDKLFEFERKCIQNFKKKNLEINYNIINAKVCSILYGEYVNAAMKNKKNNELKIKYYRYFFMFLLISIIFLAASFYLRGELNDKKISPVKVEIIETTTVNMNKDMILKESTIANSECAE